MSLALDSLKRRAKKPTDLIRMAEIVKTEIVSHLDIDGIELVCEVYDLNQDSLSQLITQTTKELAETITKSQSPLKVSLVGPFSSGKTITLCALLNQPNLLPRSSQPTSGNIVEIQVVPPQQDQNASKLMQCYLFSLLELEGMLRDYYSHLQNNYNSIRLKKLPQQPGFLREQIHILCKDVNTLLTEKWDEHRQGVMQFPFRGLTHLAHLYFMLLTIRDYLQKYPQVDNSKPLVLELPFDIQDENSKTRDWLVAITMLDMQWSLSEMSPSFLEEKAHKLTSLLPERLEEFKQLCQQGSVSNEILRALLPLYRRIVLTQEIDIKDWQGIERLSFLDIPGTGSDNRRDAYLCLNELPETHVNMLFFLANKPTMAEAQPLIDIVMEAKQYLQQLSKRLVPVINFFDTYAQIPDKIDAELERNQPDAQQKAWLRVQTFFSKQKLDNVDGLKEGFDVFDKSILGQLFVNDDDWNYYLLSPAVAVDGRFLSEKEKGYLSTYREYQERYGQLLQDVKTSIKYLRNLENWRQHYESEVAKCRRLEAALEAYQEDGGISFLREELIDKLIRNGMDLILEDARAPLQRALDQLDNQLISHLSDQVDTDDLDKEAQEAVTNQEARNKVIQLWDDMHAVTGYWNAASSTQIKLVHRGHQVTEPRGSADNDFIDPLKLCEAQVLSTVLKCSFWKKWAQKWINPSNDSTPLQELVVQYRQLEADLDAWTTQALQQTLLDTLERLENEAVPIRNEPQQKRSIRELREELERDYLHVDTLTPEEKADFKKWFSLTSMAEELQTYLDEQRKQQKSFERKDNSTTDSPEANSSSSEMAEHKVPFNENQDFNWTAVEMMKVQRQIILTLQRRVAHEFALYAAVFSQEFKKRLNNRFHTSDSLALSKEKYLQKDGIFDRFARIPLSSEESEQQSVSGMTRKQKKREAQARAALIMEGWKQIINFRGSN